jgi:hypothetical protein
LANTKARTVSDSLWKPAVAICAARSERSASGSVYQHFPNLGARGTGAGVADLGGGDTIVNAGGVRWWPGK